MRTISLIWMLILAAPLLAGDPIKSFEPIKEGDVRTFTLVQNFSYKEEDTGKLKQNYSCSVSINIEAKLKLIAPGKQTFEAHCIGAQVSYSEKGHKEEISGSGSLAKAHLSKAKPFSLIFDHIGGVTIEKFKDVKLETLLAKTIDDKKAKSKAKSILKEILKEKNLQPRLQQALIKQDLFNKKEKTYKPALSNKSKGTLFELTFGLLHSGFEQIPAYKDVGKKIEAKYDSKTESEGLLNVKTDTIKAKALVKSKKVQGQRNSFTHTLDYEWETALDPKAGLYHGVFKIKTNHESQYKTSQVTQKYNKKANLEFSITSPTLGEMKSIMAAEKQRKKEEAERKKKEAAEKKKAEKERKKKEREEKKKERDKKKKDGDNKDGKSKKKKKEEGNGETPAEEEKEGAE